MAVAVDFCRTTTENETNSSETAELFRVSHLYLSALLGIPGFISNFIVAVIIMQSGLWRHTTYLHLLNLSVNNVLSCGFSICGVTVNALTCVMALQPGYCKAYAYITFSLVCGEMMCLLHISANRYFRVVHPMFYAIYMKKISVNATILLSTWIVFPLLLLLPLTDTWSTLDYNPAKGFCSIMRSRGNHQDPDFPFLDFLDYIILLPTTTIMFYCYGAILWTFCQSSRRILTNGDTVVSTARSRHAAKLVKMVLVVIVTYMVTYFPYLTTVLINSEFEYLHPRLFQFFLYMSWCHVLSNPIVYAMLNAKIKNSCCNCIRIACDWSIAYCKLSSESQQQLNLHTIQEN